MSQLKLNLVQVLTVNAGNAEFRARPALSGDAPFLNHLYRDVRIPEFTILGLPEETILNLVDMQYSARSQSYACSFPDADDIIIEHNQIPVGHVIVAWSSPSELRIIDIALLTKWRGRGLGTALIKNLQSAASQESVRLALSVASDNPARTLYNRLGFVQDSHDGIYASMHWKEARC